MTSRERYEELVRYVTLKIPGFEVRLKGVYYKDDPWYRKIADRIAKFFAPEYDTRYATTMYPYVYVPAQFLNRPSWMYGMLRHEYIHLRDMKKYKFFFTLSYIALLPAAITMRSYWEYRGYAQNLISDVEKHGMVQMDTIDWMTEQFEGRSYAWMDVLGARANVMQMADRADKKEIYGLWPYEEGDFQTTDKPV